MNTTQPQITFHDEVFFQDEGWTVVRIGETGRPCRWAEGTLWYFVDPRWCACMVELGWQDWPIIVFITPTARKYYRHGPVIALADEQEGKCYGDVLAPLTPKFSSFLRSFFSDPADIELLPPPLRDENICRGALERCFDYAQHVPWERMSKSFIVEAVRRDCWVIRYIPAELMDEQICAETVRCNPDTLEIVPIEKLPRAVLADVARTRPDALRWVPSRFLESDLRALAGGVQLRLPDLEDADLSRLLIHDITERIRHIEE